MKKEVYSGSEQQPEQDPQASFDFEPAEKESSHVMSLEDIFKLLKEDVRYYSVQKNELVLREKADIIQKLMDEMPQDKDFAHLSPLGMYSYAAATKGVLPEEDENHARWD